MIPCQKRDWTCCCSKLDRQHMAEKCFVGCGKGLGCCKGLARGCWGQVMKEVMVAPLQQLPAGFWSRSESFRQELAQLVLAWQSGAVIQTVMHLGRG